MALSNTPTSLRRRVGGRTTRGRRARTGRAPGTPRTTGIVGTTTREPSTSSTSSSKDYVSYVYEEGDPYADMGEDAHIRLSDAKGTEVKDTSTLQAIGKGAGIGSTVGTAVPIPGVGTAVGSIVGGLAGLGTSIFGGGEPETKMRNVLPILLKAVFEKKGASASFEYPHDDKRGKGGIRLDGKAFQPERMLDAVKEIQRQLGGSDTHSTGDAEAYNEYLAVSNSPPADREKIIVGFDRPRPTSEVTSNSTAQNTSSTNGSTSTVLYLLGAGIPLAYFLTR